MIHTRIHSISAILAVFISVFAAVFSWKQVDISQEHNRKSVEPILQITPYLDSEGKRRGIFLTNDGLGPAILKEFQVSTKSVTAIGFESDRWHEILSTTEVFPDCFKTAWPKEGAAIRPGIEIPFVTLTEAKGMEACVVELVKLIGGEPIEIKIRYESIYGESKTLAADSKILSRSLDALYKKVTK